VLAVLLPLVEGLAVELADRLGLALVLELALAVR